MTTSSVPIKGRLFRSSVVSPLKIIHDIDGIQLFRMNLVTKDWELVIASSKSQEIIDHLEARIEQEEELIKWVKQNA